MTRLTRMLLPASLCALLTSAIILACGSHGARGEAPGQPLSRAAREMPEIRLASQPSVPLPGGNPSQPSVPPPVEPPPQPGVPLQPTRPPAVPTTPGAPTRPTTPGALPQPTTPTTPVGDAGVSDAYSPPLPPVPDAGIPGDSGMQPILRRD